VSVKFKVGAQLAISIMKCYSLYIYECIVYTIEQLTCLLHLRMPSFSSLTQMNVRLKGFIVKEVHQFAAS